MSIVYPARKMGERLMSAARSLSSRVNLHGAHTLSFWLDHAKLSVHFPCPRNPLGSSRLFHSTAAFAFTRVRSRYPIGRRGYRTRSRARIPAAFLNPAPRSLFFLCFLFNLPPRCRRFPMPVPACVARREPVFNEPPDANLLSVVESGTRGAVAPPCYCLTVSALRKVHNGWETCDQCPPVIQAKDVFSPGPGRLEWRAHVTRH